MLKTGLGILLGIPSWAYSKCTDILFYKSWAYFFVSKKECFIWHISFLAAFLGALNKYLYGDSIGNLLV